MLSCMMALGPEQRPPPVLQPDASRAVLRGQEFVCRGCWGTRTVLARARARARAAPPESLPVFALALGFSHRTAGDLPQSFISSLE